MVANARVSTVLDRIPSDFQSSYDWFLGTGVDKARAFLLALPSIEILAREKLKAEDVLDKLAQRHSAAVLRRFSDRSVYADAADLSTGPDIHQAEARAAQREQELLGAIDVAAKAWPPDGLSREGVALVFDLMRPDRVDLSSRLSEAAEPGFGVGRLRDFILNHIFVLLGIDDPVSAMTVRPYYPPAELPRYCYWAALHFVKREEGRPRGVGRSTGIAIQPLLDQCKSVLHTPYAAARGLPVSTADARLTAVLLFAFAVVSQATDQGHDMEYVLKEALNEVERLLATERGAVMDWLAADELVRTGVAFMSGDIKVDRRTAWMFDGDLPPYPRTLSAWSSSVLVDANRSLAAELFRLVGGQEDQDSLRVAMQATILLDRGFTTAMRDASEGRKTMIGVLWNAIWPNWEAKIQAYGQGVYLAMEAALGGDAVARSYFFTERWWKTSLWADYLREQTT